MGAAATSDRRVFGLLRAPWDAHSLGVTRVAHMIRDAGFEAHLASPEVLAGMAHLETPSNQDAVVEWVRSAGLTEVGVSYRLDPDDAFVMFSRIEAILRSAGLLGDTGQVRRLFFAGLPPACEKVRAAFGPGVALFDGEETAEQTAAKLGLPDPEGFAAPADPYDTQRMAVAAELVRSGAVYRQPLPARGHYPDFGTSQDSLVKRLKYGRRGGLPLLRTHLGPYDTDRRAAVALLETWFRTLADDGLLDVASLGTSQLTQERFGEDWTGLPNGGGVPVNSPLEYEQLWRAARPMLVRTYAGTRRIREAAAIHEQSLHIAWHTLSLWWFCESDGRGPNTVADNLAEHCATMSDIAEYGTPFEANVPHHFSFRGGDDVTYVLSAFLAARLAKSLGISTYVLQVMLTTPAVLNGTTDLARARATVALVRSLEDPTFRVVLQPRAGLDYFSTDEEYARVQLAGITMLMDDIEASSATSPEVIHVVNYSEAQSLADVSVIQESLRIVAGTLVATRQRRQRLYDNDAVTAHTELLISQARDVLTVLDEVISGPPSPQTLFAAFEAGFLPVPDLVGGREKYPEAIRWLTRATPEGVFTVDDNGRPVPPKERALAAAYNWKVRS